MTAKNPIEPFQEGLANQSVLILDGGLATELERHGADLDHELWSARILVENPDLIRDAHLAFLWAGADVIVTASYQASLAGFGRAGLDRQSSLRTMQLSVELACQARAMFLESGGGQDRIRPLVAASIGPYGACLMDGSEYTGDYALSQQELVDFHRPRMEILADSGSDLFAIETIPSALEAVALVELLEEFAPAVAWLSFSCRDRRHVSHGEVFAHCAHMAAESNQIVAIGVNCTNPKHVLGLLQSAAPISKPLIAYPNSGETWNPATNDWSGDVESCADPRDWVAAGARLVGGCCRIYPEHITELRRTLLGEPD